MVISLSKKRLGIICNNDGHNATYYMHLNFIRSIRLNKKLKSHYDIFYFIYDKKLKNQKNIYIPKIFILNYLIMRFYYKIDVIYKNNIPINFFQLIFHSPIKFLFSRSYLYCHGNVVNYNQIKLNNKFLKNIFIFLSLNLFSNILTNSFFLKKRLKKYLLNNKIDVLYHYNQASIKYKEAKKNLKVVNFLAYNYNDRKNFKISIEAIYLFFNKYQNINVYVIGKNNIDYFVKKYPKVFINKIYFYNILKNHQFNLLLKKINFAIYPSLETFGILNIEAMFYNFFIISSNKGSSKEILNNNFLIEDPNNPVKIFDKIYKIFKNKSLQKKILRHYVKQKKNYTIDQYIKKINKIFCTNQNLN